MFITQDELIRVLMECTKWDGDASPSEALAISFVESGLRRVVDSVTYRTDAGGMVILNLDADGKVIYMDIV